MPARRRMRKVSATTVLRYWPGGGGGGGFTSQAEMGKGRGACLDSGFSSPKGNTGFQASLQSQFPDNQQRVIIITIDYKLRATNRGNEPDCFAECQ